MRKFDITLSFNSVALTFNVDGNGVISLFGDNIAVFEKYTSNSFRIMLANGEDYYGSTKQVVFNRALGSLLDASSNGDYVEIEEAIEEPEDVEREAESDQEAEKEETHDNSTYIPIEGIETRRKLANICLKAFSKITGSNNGTIRKPYELASSVLSDGRTLIQTIYEDGEVIYNDGYYVVELTDNILYVDITVKAAKELEKSEPAEQVTTEPENGGTFSFPCVSVVVNSNVPSLPVSIAKESDYKYSGTDAKKRIRQIKALSESEGITAKDAVKKWLLDNF